MVFASKKPLVATFNETYALTSRKNVIDQVLNVLKYSKNT